MNGCAPIQVLNNAILNTIHASPLQVYGTDQSNERYEYQRKIPALGVNTVNTQLKKKFYGNSTNRAASHIAEKKRVNQIGIYSNTLPVKQIDNNDNISTQSAVLKRVRNGGCVVPKKCINSTIAMTPTFDGRSISSNPGDPGGKKWFNITHNRWRKFCINDINVGTDVVSGYYPDYLRGVLGTSNPYNRNNTSCNVAGGVLQSTRSAKTYTNIKNRYIYQPYNPVGF
jgi:hypothetical protein